MKVDPTNYVYYKDGWAFAKFEHPTLKAPERNFGTGTTEFWERHKTGFEALTSLCKYLDDNDIEQVGCSKDQANEWKQYYFLMDRHVAYMESIKPKQSDYSAIDCKPSFKQALGEWNMAYSCDAPNKPGYTIANND